MAKLTNNVLAFTADSQERRSAYELVEEYYNTYKSGKTANENGVSFSEMNKKMLTLFTDEIERISGQKMDANTDLAVFCNRTAVKEAAFEVVGMITDLIIPSALIKDLGSIAQIANGGWGDTLKIELQPRDLFIVTKGGRANRDFDITRQFKGEKTLVPEVRAITVGISLYEVLKGTYTLAEFVSKAVMSIETQMKYDIYDAFAAATSSLSNTAGAGQLRISGYTQDAAISLAQKVQAWNGNSNTVFLGTKLALSKILPASSNYRLMLGDEYVKLGHLRDFFGFDCIELEQVADYKTEFAVKLDDKKIYVVSPGTDKLVKVFIEGSTLSNSENSYANANLQQVATLYKSYGVAAVSSAIAGVIELA